MAKRYFTIEVVLLAFVTMTGIQTAAHAEATVPCSCDRPVESAASSIVTLARISEFSPKARSDLALAIIRLWKDPPPGELNTPIRIQHFMAQIATESAGLTTLEENLNYSAERLIKIFPTRVTAEQAQRLAHRPELIANHVYGGRLGNKDAGDGWRYRGSGFMQLTGRANFKARGKLLNEPLEEKPDLVRQPDTGFETATGYWLARKINDAAELDSLLNVRKLVNGGTNGLRESRVWLARAKRVFVDPNGPAESAPSNADELAAVAESLSDEGFAIGTGPQESSDLSEALRNFQIENEIPATGVYDEKTLYALGTPPPVDPLSPEETKGVEQQLQKLNLLSPAESSSPGDTRDALMKFQLQQGLPVTGIYDNATLETILPKDGESQQ
ncbi:peptidoglycan-binding protein [Rhizobium ruizarguesonis]